MNRGTIALAPPLCPLVVALLAGCSSMSGLDGGSRYACQAPAGVACDSVSGVYANTAARAPAQVASGWSSSRPGATPAPVAMSVATTGPAGTPSALSPTPSALADADGLTPPLPVRTPPRILRLWIKPWEDSDGDLHDQAYVYVQIDNGHWRMDYVQQQLREAAIPIRLPPGAGAPERTLSNPSRPTGIQRPATVPSAPAASQGPRP